MPTRASGAYTAIRGYPWRTALGSMGGRVMLPVSADVRSHAGIAAGDSFDLELVVDTSPRVVEVPAERARSRPVRTGR